MIVAEELTKQYGSRLAVDHVSFTVPRGEVVGFLGPNGAGKSTTLKMVAGFLPPTDGRVSVAGFDVVDDSLEARRRLGYMPEKMPLYPEMRVEEYLSFRAEIKGVHKHRRDAVERAMKQADVSDVARRLIGELSKGYQQRVGLADALVAEPELLILDEPTSGFDPNQMAEVRELIKTLGKKHTIFLSTHILSEVEAVCSRVVIISRGKIAAEGTPEEIRARMAGGGRSASLVVRGDAEKAREVVRGVLGITPVGEPTRLDGSGAQTVSRFGLELADASGSSGDTLEALVAACVGAGLGVRELKVTGKSLEAIFRELTAQDAAATPGEGEKPAGKATGSSAESKKRKSKGAESGERGA